MPDEDPKPTTTTTTEPAKPAAPVMDSAAVAAAVKDAVKAAIAENTPEPEPEPQPDPSPLRKVILDTIGADLAQAQLAANSAADLAKFYTQYPDAREFTRDVEDKFTELVRAGRPMDRESIWLYYKGANFEKFHTRAKEQEAAQLSGAASGEGVRGVGMNRGVQVIDPYSQTPEDLEKSLTGVTF